MTTTQRKTEEMTEIQVFEVLRNKQFSKSYKIFGEINNFLTNLKTIDCNSTTCFQQKIYK